MKEMGMDDEERAHQRHALRAVSKWFNIDYAFQLFFFFLKNKPFNCYSSPFSLLYVLKTIRVKPKVNMKSYTYSTNYYYVM